MMDELRCVLAEVAHDLAELVTDDKTVELAQRFVDAVADAAPREVAPSPLPVIEAMSFDGPPLRNHLLELAPSLPWKPSHRVDDGGAGVALLDFSECLDLGTLTVGAMAVGPHNAYPEHQHPPLELYLVLGGSAQWRFGGSDGYRNVDAGGLVVNQPDDLHGVRTADDAVLAVYVLDT
jgi:hypothetical protein